MVGLDYPRAWTEPGVLLAVCEAVESDDLDLGYDALCDLAHKLGVATSRSHDAQALRRDIRRARNGVTS